MSFPSLPGPKLPGLPPLPCHCLGIPRLGAEVCEPGWLGEFAADSCLGTIQADKTPLSAGGAPVLAFRQGSLADFNL